MATGTLSPAPKFYCWDITTGAPLAGGLITTYAAGTSTPLATFNNVDLDPSTHTNTNPIVLNSAGYCVIFLTPGLSYKFVVTDANGVPQWSQDNVTSVPASATGVDETVTAGESIAAEDTIYISDGSGSKNAGQVYKADSAQTYSSTLLTVGKAVAAIASGASGQMRTAGQMVIALTALTPGALYYVGTAGALTATAPSNARLVGQAIGINSLNIMANPPPTVSLDYLQLQVFT